MSLVATLVRQQARVEAHNVWSYMTASGQWIHTSLPAIVKWPIRNLLLSTVDKCIFGFWPLFIEAVLMLMLATLTDGHTNQYFVKSAQKWYRECREALSDLAITQLNHVWPLNQMCKGLEVFVQRCYGFEISIVADFSLRSTTDHIPSHVV